MVIAPEVINLTLTVSKSPVVAVKVVPVTTPEKVTFLSEDPLLSCKNNSNTASPASSDVKTGKPCGRSKGEKRGYPACRPSKRVSSKTPKTASEMSSSEKARFKREKTGSKKITYQHRRKKKKK